MERYAANSKETQEIAHSKFSNRDPEYAVYTDSSWNISLEEGNLLRQQAEKHRLNALRLASENQQLIEENKQLWKQIYEYQCEQKLSEQCTHDSRLRVQELEKAQTSVVERETLSMQKEEKLQHELREERATRESMWQELDKARRSEKEAAEAHAIDLQKLREELCKEVLALKERHRSELVELQVRARNLSDFSDVERSAELPELDADHAATVQELRNQMNMWCIECRRLRTEVDRLQEELSRPYCHQQQASASTTTTQTKREPPLCVTPDMLESRQKIEFLKISYEHLVNQLKDAEFAHASLESQLNGRDALIEHLKAQRKAVDARAEEAERRFDAAEKAIVETRSNSKESTGSKLMSFRGSAFENGHADHNLELTAWQKETEVHSLQAVNAVVRRQLDAVRKENVQLRLDRCNMVPSPIAGSSRGMAFRSEVYDTSQIDWRQKLDDLKLAGGPPSVKHLDCPQMSMLSPKGSHHMSPVSPKGSRHKLNGHPLLSPEISRCPPGTVNVIQILGRRQGEVEQRGKNEKELARFTAKRVPPPIDIPDLPARIPILVDRSAVGARLATPENQARPTASKSLSPPGSPASLSRPSSPEKSPTKSGLSHSRPTSPERSAVGFAQSNRDRRKLSSDSPSSPTSPTEKIRGLRAREPNAERFVFEYKPPPPRDPPPDLRPNSARMHGSPLKPTRNRPVALSS